jgi:hypothetical protein
MSTVKKKEDDGVTEDETGTRIFEVESYRYAGRTRVFENEMHRLKDRAVEPTFQKPPRWNPIMAIMLIGGAVIMLPLTFIVPLFF